MSKDLQAEIGQLEALEEPLEALEEPLDGPPRRLSSIAQEDTGGGSIERGTSNKHPTSYRYRPTLPRTRHRAYP